MSLDPSDPGAWPRVAEALSALLFATEKGHEAAELAGWTAVVEGRPIFAWVAIHAFARPGILAARASGYLLSGADVDALTRANGCLRFDQAPEVQAVGGVPVFRPDLYRPAASVTNELPSIPCASHPGKSLADCGCPTAAESMGVNPGDLPF